MTVFKLGSREYEKWIHQNNAGVLDLVEGCLLDSVLVDCKRGVAAMFETALNTWSSAYLVYFAPYNDPDALATVNNMWDTFAGAALFDAEGGVA